MVLVIKEKKRKAVQDTSKSNKSSFKKNKSSTKKQPKFLKKPKAKGPASVSAHKALKEFAKSTGPLVREVQEVEIVQDNRSQFFKRELEKESKWLG